jgi:hypothetical protein
MQSLKIDIIFPWEIGLILVFFSLIVILIGVRQGRNENDDFDNIPFTKPTTKIFFGSVFLLFGLIQLLPLLK